MLKSIIHNCDYWDKYWYHTVKQVNNILIWTKPSNIITALIARFRHWEWPFQPRGQNFFTCQMCSQRKSCISWKVPAWRTENVVLSFILNFLMLGFSSWIICSEDYRGDLNCGLCKTEQVYTEVEWCCSLLCSLGNDWMGNK